MSRPAGQRLLVTGASGFIGLHVVEAAAAAGHEVVAAVRSEPSGEPGPGSFGAERVETGVDLSDHERLAAVVRSARPDAVIHLAGFAHVGWSHGDPAGAIAVNAAGSAALLSAVVAEAPEARVVLASTSEVYGRSPAPLHEGSPLAPESPYGWSKRWMEETAGYFRERHGLSIGVARSFAHSGAGQGPAFAVSNFARQVAEARRAGQTECVVRTGRKATVRDLSDVRDAALGYLALAAARDVDGPVNLGSGQGRSTADVVAAVGAAAGIAVDHVEGPELVRTGENPQIVADVSLAASALGWRPTRPFDETAAAAVDHWLAVLERDPTQGTGVSG